MKTKTKSEPRSYLEEHPLYTLRMPRAFHQRLKQLGRVQRRAIVGKIRVSVLNTIDEWEKDHKKPLLKIRVNCNPADK